MAQDSHHDTRPWKKKIKKRGKTVGTCEKCGRSVGETYAREYEGVVRHSAYSDMPYHQMPSECWGKVELNDYGRNTFNKEKED